MTNIGTTTVIRKTFEGLEEETLKALRTFAQRRNYPPKTKLCHQGQIEHTFYVIVEGHLAVSQTLEGGEERLLEVLGPNCYFGEMGLLDDTPRMADVITMTPATVLEVTEEVFDRFVEESPALANHILRRILSTSRRNDKRNINALQEKNAALQRAYEDLQAAQEKLIEKKRLERELELAADVQRSLLPGRLPQFSDYGFAAYLQPARQVGGDFYDVLAIDDEHVGVLIADVADKGFHAALFMAVSRTLFRQAGQQLLSPAAVALAVHEGMLDVATTDDTFVTAFYGVLHRPSGRFTYVRAAQDRPLLYRPGSGVQALPGDGRFLGMMPNLQLEEHVITLRPGDRLVLYSDGVTDAVNLVEAHYGKERLAATVSDGGDRSAPQLVQHIANDVATFCAEAAPFDDLTLLVVEVKER